MGIAQALVFHGITCCLPAVRQVSLTFTLKLYAAWKLSCKNVVGLRFRQRFSRLSLCWTTLHYYSRLPADSFVKEQCISLRHFACLCAFIYFWQVLANRAVITQACVKYYRILVLFHKCYAFLTAGRWGFFSPMSVCERIRINFPDCSLTISKNRYYYWEHQLVMLTAIVHQWSNCRSVRPLSFNRGTAQQGFIAVLQPGSYK